MKIGILTQPLHINYGGLLQNYALQQVLKSLGHDVETIDHGERHISSLHQWLHFQKNSILHLLNKNKYQKPKYIPSAKENAIIRQHTDYFINKYINHTRKLHSSKEFVQQYNTGQYDALIVGSDQCWRPKYNAFLEEMFLSFAGNYNIKRIAYAVSFGTREWEMSSQSTRRCSLLAQKFDYISVREDSGVELCKNYLLVDATQVLDPTLLLTKEDYIRLVEQEHEPKSQGTLFEYILDPTNEKSDFINTIANKYNLTPFKVLPRIQQETRTKLEVKKRIVDCIYPPVTTWLRAFMDAEMVIVDSFHGMVFSIIFNKPFWVICNKDRGLSRFTSLLQLLGLEERLCDEKILTAIDIRQPIKWKDVNKKLSQERQHSLHFLHNALK